MDGCRCAEKCRNVTLFEDLDITKDYPRLNDRVHFDVPWKIRGGVAVLLLVVVDFLNWRLLPWLIFSPPIEETQGTTEIDMISSIPASAVPDDLFISMKEILDPDLEEKVSLAWSRALTEHAEVHIEPGHLPDDTDSLIVELDISSVKYNTTVEVPLRELRSVLEECEMEIE